MEKVRKRMFGDYDEMRQKIRQLTQDLSVSPDLGGTVVARGWQGSAPVPSDLEMFK